MSASDANSGEKDDIDTGIPPGVIAQAQAIAANNLDNASPASRPRLARTTTEQAHLEAIQEKTQRAYSHGDTDTTTQPTNDAQSIPRSTAGQGLPSYVQETSIEDAPPPAYSETYGKVDMSQDGFDTRAMVANDGRVNINIHQSSRRLSNLLVPALRSQLNLHQEELPLLPPGSLPPSVAGVSDAALPPPLNIVIHVVGSRGDVQPFVALGQVLKRNYGHRVRLATHSTFRTFVEENGLEFFSIGGDPAELMAFMVKNPGLMPGMDMLRSGEIGKKRKSMYEMVKGCWRSCFEAGDGTGIEASDDHLDNRTSFDSGISIGEDLMSKPFVADAIIANPPSFAHIHCAEKLGIPLHLMFTMPWSPTQAFPHPLANIQSTNADANMTNFVSYALVEMMTWQGLGDVINRFREKSLGLEPVSLMWAPGMASRLRIPYTYCWSPALIPKPKDWGPHISISGFYFLSLANNYSPPTDLVEFLNAGPPPVYIGFGSIVVDDPDAMTKLIFEAVEKTGQRALVSKGWGGFGADTVGIPEGVFMLGNVPHDWLFKHVSCVVHHGGAGTTAAGIALGKPTIVVPFFGDQPFWGAMVAKAGAGPSPIPGKQLTSDNLAAAIMEALKPTVLRRAQELGGKIGAEKGTVVGAENFHERLGVETLRCSLAPTRAAVWRVKRTEIRLSAFAAAVLGNEGLLDFNDLKLYRPREYDSEDGPWDPITGATSALLGTLGSLMMGVADFPVDIIRAVRDTKEMHRPSVTPVTSSTDLGSTQASSPSVSTVDASAQYTASPSEETQVDRSSQGPQDGHSSVSSIENAANASSERLSRGSSMKLALGQALSRSSSGNRSGSSTPTSPHHRTLSDHNSSPLTLDHALGAGKGVGRIVGAGLKSPMDFTLSIARGFHNAPKLYGDESVRQSDKITGFQSGLKAAGKEFGFGLYDGIAGLVTQPLDGAKKEGFTGLLKGFGKGIGGVVLKPSAAAWGIPGYTFKGIYKELQKHMGNSVQNYIIAARTAQGFDDWTSSTAEERLDVVRRWHVVQVELGKQKHKPKHHRSHSPSCFAKTRHMTFDERKKYAEKKKKQKEEDAAESTTRESITELSHAQTHPGSFPSSSDGVGLEEAISESVRATSKGNVEEDAAIERAIRASVAELQLASNEGDNEDAIQRAIQASIAEHTQQDRQAAKGAVGNGFDQRAQLEVALQSSLQGNGFGGNRSASHTTETEDDSGIDTDDDENIKTAIANSKNDSGTSQAMHVDQDLLRAIEQSRQSQLDREQAELKAKAEEEIVLEYIKRQSAAEEQHKRSIEKADTS